MAEEKVSLLKAREAAQYLNVSLATLDRMEKERKLTPFRTPGGHHHYNLAMLNEYLERSRQRSPSVRPSMRHARNVRKNKLQDGKVRILVVDHEPETVELIIRSLREDRDVYEFASASNDLMISSTVSGSWAIAGAGFAGILGMFLAAPILASLRILGSYVYCKLLDQEPFDELRASSFPVQEVLDEPEPLLEKEDEAD